MVLQAFVIEQCHEFNILVGCIPLCTSNKLNLKKKKILPCSKLHTGTGCEGSEDEEKYSATLCLTMVVDGVCGHHHALAFLPPGKRSGTHSTGCWPHGQS